LLSLISWNTAPVRRVALVGRAKENLFVVASQVGTLVFTFVLLVVSTFRGVALSDNKARATHAQVLNVMDGAVLTITYP